VLAAVTGPIKKSGVRRGRDAEVTAGLGLPAYGPK